MKTVCGLAKNVRQPHRTPFLGSLACVFFSFFSSSFFFLSLRFFSFPLRFSVRYVLSFSVVDYSGCEWFSAFNDVAEVSLFIHLCSSFVCLTSISIFI
jgi:hypothetical protein